MLDKQKAPNQPNQTQIQIMIERGEPLCAHSKQVRTQCSTIWTLTSEYLDCHIQSWKQAENSLVRELVKKIENHPHRQDLQQNNAYNTVSEKSKKMIRDMGNVELLELCETIPKVQCKECLLSWNQGIVYCICGDLLKESEASRGILQWTLDLLTIQNYVIEKGRPHGHRFWEDSRTKRHIILPII